MTTITLPPLPEPDVPTCYNQDGYPVALSKRSEIQVRTIQREAMRAALEAAAKVCGDIASRANIAWCLSGQEHDFVQSCELQKLAESIRALRIEGETPAMHGFNDERSAL